MTRSRFIVSLALFTALGQMKSVQALDAFEIVKKSDVALRGRTQHGKAAMTVRRPEWERTLEMEFWDQPG